MVAAQVLVHGKLRYRILCLRAVRKGVTFSHYEQNQMTFVKDHQRKTWPNT